MVAPSGREDLANAGLRENSAETRGLIWIVVFHSEAATMALNDPRQSIKYHRYKYELTKAGPGPGTRSNKTPRDPDR